MKQGMRPGGRSLRVQQAVHAAVSRLIALHGREGLSVPQIAQEAGVTPSTIYRRWGNLSTLLGDVAQQNLRLECPVRPTGDLAVDLTAWAELYQEEMDSVPGREMIRDVVQSWNGTQAACDLLELARLSVDAVLAAVSPPAALQTEVVIDAIVAPIVTRILFTDAPLPSGFARGVVERLLGVSFPGASPQTPPKA